MPISYRYDQQQNFLFVVGLGEVSVQDLQHYHETVRQEPLQSRPALSHRLHSGTYCFHC